MRAGKLKHRIALDSPVSTQNATGEEEITWVQLGYFWASIEPLKGREQFSGDQILAAVDTRVRIRWSPATDQITEKWRLRHQDLIYDIESVARIEFGQREIEIMCKAGKNRG